MKKLLCILLVLILAAAAVTCVQVSAASDTLTVTDGGRVLATVKVGSEFIYRVGVNAGDRMIYSGQGYVKYNKKYMQVVEYGPTDSRGNIDMDAYCFCDAVQNTSLVANYFATENNIRYNFTSPKKGAGVFNDENAPYFKVRFKALAAGKVELNHVFEVLSTNVNGNTVRIFTDGTANRQLDPLPFQKTSAEAPTALVGDADSDFEVTVMDATFIQHVTAGKKAAFEIANADVNGDGDVNLRDALSIRRYKIGLTTDAAVGEWIFESEQGDQLSIR